MVLVVFAVSRRSQGRTNEQLTVISGRLVRRLSGM